MKHYGLIGYPLTHSFSKIYFTEKFEKEHIHDTKYDLFPMEHITALPKLLNSNPDLCGLNVTIPHKVSVLKYLDWIEPDAKAAGAVNCIRISAESPVLAAFSGEVGIKGHDFRLEGFNTDLYGFEMSLRPLLKDYHDQALILGDGGAAKAVKCVLENLGINFRIVTRKPIGDNLLFKDLKPHHINQHLLITNKHILYDMVYNPEKTLFLTKGEEYGATIKNGYEMLILQAEKSWEIWTSKQLHP
jgi:shikimate dehydrogenase